MDPCGDSSFEGFEVYVFPPLMWIFVAGENKGVGDHLNCSAFDFDLHWISVCETKCEVVG